MQTVITCVVVQQNVFTNTEPSRCILRIILACRGRASGYRFRPTDQNLCLTRLYLCFHFLISRTNANYNKRCDTCCCWNTILLPQPIKKLLIISLYSFKFRACVSLTRPSVIYDLKFGRLWIWNCSIIIVGCNFKSKG